MARRSPWPDGFRWWGPSWPGCSGAAQAPWLFAGTGLKDGSAFAKGGIEIDATAPASPKGVRVLAEIPDLPALGREHEQSRAMRVLLIDGIPLDELDELDIEAA